jgi:hypothetical protein
MDLHTCSSPTNQAPILRCPTIVTIKGVDAMTTAGGIGTMTAAAEVEAEVEAGITMITASLWIRVGIDLGIEEVGMDHREGKGVGLEKISISFMTSLRSHAFVINIVIVRSANS